MHAGSLLGPLLVEGRPQLHHRRPEGLRWRGWELNFSRKPTGTVYCI